MNETAIERASARHPTTRALVALIYLLVTAGTLVWGFGFGMRIGGTLMGAVTGVLTALFCSLLLSGAIDCLRELLQSKGR